MIEIILYPNPTVYMCEVNPDSCPPHLISTYTCGVTIAPRVCDGGTLCFEGAKRHWHP